MHKYLTITQLDGSVWGVPIAMIAQNRAEFYASEFGGDVERSLKEDINPLFEESEYSISEWARNQMNWHDFDGHQVNIKGPGPVNFNEAWMSGEGGFSD